MSTLYTAAADGSPVLTGDRCPACGAVYFPALRFGCEQCGSAVLEPTSIDATGSLLTFAVVRVSDEPYAIGEIALDAGPVVRAQVLPGDGSGLEFDARVRGTLVDDTVYFEAA